MVETTADASDWEARLKLTANFQTRVSSVQQGAATAITSATIVITVGIAMLGRADISTDESWAMLFAAVIGWLLLLFMLTVSFARRARRVRNDYLAEHRRLFPDVEPYALESFLLDAADRNPRLTGGSDAA